MFLMYPPQKKNQVERDLGFDVARVFYNNFTIIILKLLLKLI